jgi:putative transposase
MEPPLDPKQTKEADLREGEAPAEPVIPEAKTSVIREGEAPAEPLAVRRHPTHGVLEISNQPAIIFLTVCTENRKPWLASPEHHSLLRSIWTEATGWLTGRYVLMPEHLHLFAAPGTMDLPLENWVRFWKSQFRKRNSNKTCRFQTDHWDTRLRRTESYDEKWDYVVNNPVRRGLVQHSEDWPYQGMIYELPW